MVFPANEVSDLPSSLCLSWTVFPLPSVFQRRSVFRNGCDVLSQNRTLTLTLALLIMTFQFEESVIVKKLTNLTTPLRTVTHTYTPTPTSKGSRLGNVKIKDPQSVIQAQSMILPGKWVSGIIYKIP